jgi:hypothetical protein
MERQQSERLWEILASNSEFRTMIIALGLPERFNQVIPLQLPDGSPWPYEIEKIRQASIEQRRSVASYLRNWALSLENQPYPEEFQATDKEIRELWQKAIEKCGTQLGARKLQLEAK